MSEKITIENEVPAEEKLKINRREALNLAWLASLGFLVMEVGGITVLFAYPRFKEGEFGGIYTFGKVSDLPQKGEGPANFPKVKLWLSHTDDGLSALYKVCPHLGCLYSWSDQDGKFICPCHGSQYELDGDYIQGPAPRSLDRFSIRIVDGETGEVLVNSADNDYAPIKIEDLPENAIVQIDTGDKELGETHA